MDESAELPDDIKNLSIGGEYEFTAEIKQPDRMTVGDVILAL